VLKLIGGLDKVDEPDSKAEGLGILKSDSDDAVQISENDTKVDNSQLKIQGSALFQIPIPHGLKTYDVLYKYLASTDMIPLGLLRGTMPKTSIGPRFNRFPYVFTNPDKSTELYDCDKVFVLSPTPVHKNDPAVSFILILFFLITWMTIIDYCDGFAIEA